VRGSWGRGVSDEGLAALSGLSNLQELDRTGTKGTPEGIATLKNVLPKCSITGPASKDRFSHPNEEKRGRESFHRFAI
jgi:hypothetical protein